MISNIYYFLLYKLDLDSLSLHYFFLLMLLFKYERFIHDFVGFEGCLLDPKTKPKERAKWSFHNDF